VYVCYNDQVKEIKMGRVRSTNGEKRHAYRILVGKPEGKRPLEDLDVGGQIIVTWILEAQDGMIWTGFMWLRIGQVEGPCEHGNEPSGSIKFWEILE
jgi:hypothetical protein